MSALVLFRNELIKTLHRLAFWVTTVAFGGLMTLIFTQLHFQRLNHKTRPPFTLPGGWAEIMEPAPVAAFFGAVLLILLVASEFSWRTARQNVIDGLSKSQFFLGKLILFLAICLLFFVVQVGIGGGIGLYGTDLAVAVAPLVRAADAWMLGGFLLCLLGYGSLAMLIALTTRNAGPAMGAFFLYVALLERLIGGGIARASERLAPVAGYLPTAIFNRLLQPANYDPAVVERAVAAGRPAPEVMDPGVLFAVAGSYIVVLIAAAFLDFRRRDL